VRILITNDDGVNARGLRLLESVVRQFTDDIWVVAPSEEQSGAGHSLTLTTPVRLRRHDERRFSVTGTPTDAVMLALAHVMKDSPPDVILSGINRGANLAEDVTYSGTVSAAMEGTLLGIPSIAISLIGRGDFRFDTAATFARRLTGWVLERGLPADTLLNVNVPAPADGRPVRGFALTRMGRRRYGDAIVEKVDPRGKKYYWIGGEELQFEDAEGTDFHAVSQGLVSVTPIHLDLTNYKSFDALRGLKLAWP